jgi:hypothetical protein
MPNVITLSVVMLNVAFYFFAMLSVIMLNVIMLGVVMLSVVAPMSSIFNQFSCLASNKIKFYKNF